MQSQQRRSTKDFGLNWLLRRSAMKGQRTREIVVSRCAKQTANLAWQANSEIRMVAVVAVVRSPARKESARTVKDGVVSAHMDPNPRNAVSHCIAIPHTRALAIVDVISELLSPRFP